MLKEGDGMKIKYSMDYNNCYLANLNDKSDFKILKKELNGNTMNEIIKINYNNIDYDNIIKTLKDSKNVINIDIIYKGEKMIVISSTIKTCNIISLIKKYSNNTNFENNETVDASTHIWGVSLENMEDIKMLGESLKKEIKGNVSIKLDHKNTMKSESFYILKEALNLGYFDVPKRINLIELSKALNIKPTKLDITIRTLLNRFLEESFNNINL